MGSMNMRDKSLVPDSVKVGVGVDAIAMSPVDRTADPGVGLEDVGHKVLTYRDLMSLTSNPDTRPPQRTIEVHLTGNMERFMRSEEHTSELQSLMRISYAVFCLKKKRYIIEISL